MLKVAAIVSTTCTNLSQDQMEALIAKLLMTVVLAIVAFGPWITYLQFTGDERLPRYLARKRPSGQASGAAEAASENASTLELGPQGVEITSRVIGLLVLGFSLAFYYLYVKVVYPMQEVELQRQARTTSERPPEAPKR